MVWLRRNIVFQHTNNSCAFVAFVSLICDRAIQYAITTIVVYVRSRNVCLNDRLFVILTSYLIRLEPNQMHKIVVFLFVESNQTRPIGLLLLFSTYSLSSHTLDFVLVFFNDA